MSHEKHLPMFVVDLLRYDIEQVPKIVNLLNDVGGVGWRVFWPRDFSECEVFEALKHLMQCGFVQPLIESLEERAIVPFKDQVLSLEEARPLWFVLTDRARAAWESWEDYPVSDVDQPDV